MDSAFKRHLRFTQLISLDAQQPLKGSFRIKEKTFCKTSVDLNEDTFERQKGHAHANSFMKMYSFVCNKNVCSVKYKLFFPIWKLSSQSLIPWWSLKVLSGELYIHFH